MKSWCSSVHFPLKTFGPKKNEPHHFTYDKVGYTKKSIGGFSLGLFDSHHTSQASSDRPRWHMHGVRGLAGTGSGIATWRWGGNFHIQPASDKWRNGTALLTATGAQDENVTYRVEVSAWVPWRARISQDRCNGQCILWPCIIHWALYSCLLHMRASSGQNTSS